MKKIYYLFLIFLLSETCMIYAQTPEKVFENELKHYFASYKTTARIKQPEFQSLTVDENKKTITITVSESLAYQPFTSKIVDEMYESIQKQLPKSLRKYQLKVYTNESLIEELIPNAFRSKKTKDKSRLSLKTSYKGSPWVKSTSKPHKISEGLQNRHIALWQSHGSYYIKEKNEWGWQRPNLFCTTEDLFTQSFIVPYIIPMLENAGACVFTPRERDIQHQEVIVDNDTSNGSIYLEENSKKSRWASTNKPGFAQKKNIYLDNENPFEDGTARFISTEKKSGKAFAQWIPTFTESGKYAVYVSYQTLPNSVSDAKYIVCHQGGVSEFSVNQQMGAGTWVYLGTFDFAKGSGPQSMVLLSNESKQKGVVCADAVRFGGGMGNIMRGDNVSGYPRHLEGARYTAQWSGMPYDVYSPRKGDNDYADDINTRSHMMNHLSGGSVFNPSQSGMNVPFEMSMALHSDAGYSEKDGIIGSLGVYTTNFNDKKLNAGNSRMASRDLCDLILTQMDNDIRSNPNFSWSRRGMWDRNYSETRLPSAASTIIEILSHQNFADMRLGHDPNFKFTLSRAIYKGILQFLSEQHGIDYIVQPLPISHFSITRGNKKNTLILNWKGENDPLEPTAIPREYIVYTAMGNQAFDNGVVVKNNTLTTKIEPGIIYSYKIAALNKGGESFPSEILSAYIAPNEKSQVMIVNGFNRLSGPSLVNTSTEAGFDIETDPGVAYQNNISICGAQTVFDRKQGGKEGAGALGYSNNDLCGTIIAGNTFNYPYIHGKAIRAAGNYSFVSCSDEAVENGKVKLEDYQVVDLILGLEKDDAANFEYYKTFSSPLQRALTSYCSAGGNLMISGAYVGSDMSQSQGNRDFTEKLLKYKYGGSLTPTDTNAISGLGMTLTLPQTLNDKQYMVSSSDCIVPTDNAFSAMVYAPGNESAAIAYKGDYRTFVLGFPFESITTDNQRANIMASILQFFTIP